ncbi:MAG: di-heme oxidoredictase family protein [Pyrinomonadaceae bacterium]
MKFLKLSLVTAFVVALALATASRSAVESQTIQEAPTTDMNVLTDDLFNGLGPRGTPIDECVGGPPVANRSFEDNKFIFEERETADDGLGPTYNDTSCSACHQSPETGGISQTNELRAGHLNSAGTFVNPPGGSSLIQLRAIAAPIQERLDNAPLENIRTFRTSLNVIGDGFVEAISNTTLQNLAAAQPAEFRGTVINVPVVEAGGALRVARFGWKNQHASLVSFSGDAYLNEMGITNPFDGSGGTVENNSLGASVAAFDTVADPEDDGADAEAFANFMRATRAPGRGTITAAAQNGQALFNQINCSVCHTPSIVTAPAGTLINGGAATVPAVLGDERIRPFGDFLLHNVGTGDGIVQNGGAATRNMVRTPPLWGVRTRPLLMHDGLSFTFAEAIQRHAGQATSSRNAFNALTAAQKNDVIAFLKSL